jgi:ribonuclease HII
VGGRKHGEGESPRLTRAAIAEKRRREENRRARRRERYRLRRLLEIECRYLDLGYTRIAGVDEAGMGPLAGPVVAAAVILPARLAIDGANDSKQLTTAARESLFDEIRSRALCYGLGVASVQEINLLNIYQSGMLAMRRALDALTVAPGLVLLDARTLPDLPWPQEAHVRGDACIHCVACASILAKVHRDRLMDELDRQYPGYGLAQHKGYATAEHRAAIRRLGPAPIHRRSFHGIAQIEMF